MYIHVRTILLFALLSGSYGRLTPAETACFSWSMLVATVVGGSGLGIGSVLVFGFALPSREHGIEVGPAVESDHDEMSWDEGDKAAHRDKMPDSGEVESTEEEGEP